MLQIILLTYWRRLGIYSYFAWIELESFFYYDPGIAKLFLWKDPNNSQLEILFSEKENIFTRFLAIALFTTFQSFA